jgi:hypothetical protein
MPSCGQLSPHVNLAFIQKILFNTNLLIIFLVLVVMFEWSLGYYGRKFMFNLR